MFGAQLASFKQMPRAVNLISIKVSIYMQYIHSIAYASITK